MLTFTPTSSDVFAFTHRGVEIVNPLISECGRSVYNPADPASESIPRGYGFEVLETGGGCTAWHAEGMLNGRKVYVLVTDDDARHEVDPVNGCRIGLYDDETGDQIVEWLQPYEGDPVVEQIGHRELYLRALATVSADDPPECPQCSGPGILLGTLGSTDHYRCRNCGWEFTS